MAKNTKYKLTWIKCGMGVEWDAELGWEIVSALLYTQDGQILCLLRGLEK